MRRNRPAGPARGDHGGEQQRPDRALSIGSVHVPADAAATRSVARPGMGNMSHGRRCNRMARSVHRTTMMVSAMADVTSGTAPAQAEFTARLEAVLDPAHRLATVLLRDRTAAE